MQYNELKMKYDSLLQQTHRRSINNDQALDAMTSIVDAVTQGNFSVLSAGSVDMRNNSNAMVDLVNTFLAEINRLTNEMNRGKFGGQIQLPNANGAWKQTVDNFNAMSRNISTTLGTVSQSINSGTKVDLRLEGELQQLANVVNALDSKVAAQFSAIAQFADSIKEGRFEKISIEMDSSTKNSLNSLATHLETLVKELNRVTRDFSEGKLGGQANAYTSGTWKELLDNLNLMAAIYTGTVRNVNLTLVRLNDGSALQVNENWPGELGELKNNLNFTASKNSEMTK